MAILMAVLTATGVCAEQKPTCAVLTFEAKSGISPDEATILSDRFETELNGLGRHTLMSRTKMGEILKAQEYAAKCSASECAIEAGKLLAIQYIVFGSVGRIGSTYTVNVNLVNVETGAIERSANYDLRGAIDDLLTRGMVAAAHKLLGLPVPAAPATVAEPPRAQPQRFPPEIAATPPQEVSGIWKKADSPRLITANLLVPSSASLTIEPGVQVIFEGHYYLRVDGTIRAQGTEAEPIAFTARDHDQGWGGVRLLGNKHDNTFSHLTFEYGRCLGPYVPPYHTPDMEGAAVFMEDSKAAFDHCVFRYNVATVNGSAISSWGDMEVVVDHCRFFYNETRQDLAGMGAVRFHTGGGHPKAVKVTNSEIAFNTAMDEEAAIAFSGGGYPNDSVEVANNVFHDNTAMGRWAPNSIGVAMFGGGRIYNNVFYRNHLAPDAVGPLTAMIWFHGTNVFENNIVFENTMPGPVVYIDGNASIIEHNDIQGGHSGAGNINADPLFEDAPKGVFRLKAGSPCIDAGDDSIIPKGAVDSDGKPRIQGKRVDMGAVESGRN